MERKKIKSESKTVNVDYGSYLFLGFMIIILVLLVFGVYRLKTNLGTSYDYQGEKGIYKIDKNKVFNIEVYSIHVTADGMEYIYSFRNHPSDLGEVSLEPNLIEKLNRPEGVKNLYVTRDLNLGEKTNHYDVVAASTFEQILGTGKAGLYRLNLKNAYTNYKEGFPEITCNDVANDNHTAVIYLRLGSGNKVYSNKNYDCVIIEGKDADGLIKAGERFGYYLLGVF